MCYCTHNKIDFESFTQNGCYGNQLQPFSVLRIWIWVSFEVISYHLHLVSMNDQSTMQLNTSLLATPCWQDSTRSKQLSTVAILGFQFGLYHVVPLSFLLSVSLASLFSHLSIFGWSDHLQILHKPAAFLFGVLCIIVFKPGAYPENSERGGRVPFPPPSPLPRVTTFKDMQHIKLWAHSWWKVK